MRYMHLYLHNLFINKLMLLWCDGEKCVTHALAFMHTKPCMHACTKVHKCVHTHTSQKELC